MKKCKPHIEFWVLHTDGTQSQTSARYSQVKTPRKGMNLGQVVSMARKGAGVFVGSDEWVPLGAIAKIQRKILQ